MRPIGSALLLSIVAACATASVDTSQVSGVSDPVAPTTLDVQITGSSTSQPDNGGVFSEATGKVLLFDDGIEGVLSVDLDHRIAARRVLDNQRAGDAMYRLERVGEMLIVGWGEVHAMSLDTLETHNLGEATIFVPAEEPDAVWLITYPGGRIGQGTPTYRLVRLDGTEIVSATGLDPAENYPALGIPGGLVHEATQGIVLWDAKAGGVVRLGEDGNGFVADVSHSLIAWCEGECILHLTEIGGEDTTMPSPIEDQVFEPRSSRFSPDGRLLAAIMGWPGPIDGTSKATVVIIEVESGETTIITESLLPRPSYLVWSQDGRDLFFSSWSYQEQETVVGWYRLDDGHSEVARLPFGGALSLLVLERDEAGAFLPTQLGPQAECGQVSTYPSGREGICGFRF